ncbi:MAG: hypothetical protein V1735_02390 [Nanoarchaeota archaeon]
MDYSQIKEFKRIPFVNDFIQGKITPETFRANMHAFCSDHAFCRRYGLSPATLPDEMQRLEEILRGQNHLQTLPWGVTRYHSPVLSEKMGCLVDVLDFSTTPSGTHKYVKARKILSLPYLVEPRRFILISAGNYAMAMIRALKDTGGSQELVILVDKGFRENNAFKSSPVRLIKVDFRQRHPTEFPLFRLIFSREECAAIYSDKARMNFEFQTNCNVTDFYQFLIYAPHFATLPEANFQETVLYRDVLEIPDTYDLVTSPCGSGELLYGLHRCVKAKTLCGVVPDGAHPLSSQAPVSPEMERFAPGMQFGFQQIKRTKAKALGTPHFDLGHLLPSPFTDWWKKVQFIKAKDADFISANHLAREAGISSEISGSAGLVAFSSKFKKNFNLSHSSRILVVNTGNGGLLR